VLAIGAHPDDVEMLCAGTLVLLHAQGWKVACATMTAGDCGSTTLGKREISAIRREEATRSAALLDGTYQCMDCEDVFVMYDRPTLLKVIALIRQVRPAIVFTMSPQDYMVDHEITGTIAQTACFAAGMKNIETEGAIAFPEVPYLYYCDPLDGRDKFGNEIAPTTLVNIGGSMGLKEQMFLCHESQRGWLKAHHGMDDAIRSIRDLGEKRGELMGTPYAEGFRQHLGHAFPQGNILKQILGDLVHLPPTAS